MWIYNTDSNRWQGEPLTDKKENSFGVALFKDALVLHYYI